MVGSKEDGALSRQEDAKTHDQEGELCKILSRRRFLTVA